MAPPRVPQAPSREPLRTGRSGDAPLPRQPCGERLPRRGSLRDAGTATSGAANRRLPRSTSEVLAVSDEAVRRVCRRLRRSRLYEAAAFQHASRARVRDGHTRFDRRHPSGSRDLECLDDAGGREASALGVLSDSKAELGCVGAVDIVDIDAT